MDFKEGDVRAIKGLLWALALAIGLWMGSASGEERKIMSGADLEAALREAQPGTVMELGGDITLETGGEVREGVTLKSGGYCLTVCGELCVAGEIALNALEDLSVESVGLVRIGSQGKVTAGGTEYIGTEGTWSVEPGGEFRLGSGGIVIEAGVVKARGAVRETGTIQVEKEGTLEIEGRLEAAGSLKNFGVVRVMGTCRLENQATNNGNLDVEEGGQVSNEKLTLNNGRIEVRGQLTNQGNMRNKGSLDVAGKGRIDGTGRITGTGAQYDVMLTGKMYGLEGALEAAETGEEVILNRDAEVKGEARLKEGVRLKSQGNEIVVIGVLEVAGELDIQGVLKVAGEVRVCQGGLVHVESEGGVQIEEGGNIKIEGEAKWEGEVEGQVSYGVTLEGEIRLGEQGSEGYTKRMFLNGDQIKTLYAGGANFEQWEWTPEEALSVAGGHITDRQIAVTLGSMPSAATLYAREKEQEQPEPPTPTPTATPIPTASPTPEPSPQASSEPAVTPTPTPGPTPEPSPQASPEPAVTPTPTPGPTPEPSPQASPEPAVTPTPTPGPTPEPSPQASPEPTITPAPGQSGEGIAYKKFRVLAVAKGAQTKLPAIPGGAKEWQIEDGAVAKLVGKKTDEMKVKGIKLGSTRLYFTAQGEEGGLRAGERYYIQLEVRKAKHLAQGVKVKPKALNMLPGETRKIQGQLTGSRVLDKQLVYESSDGQVAQVDSEGNVRATGLGKAQITAYSANMKKGTSQIEVAAVVIRDGKGEDLGDIVELKRGESLKLKVKSLWEEGRVKIAWGSDAPKIVEVDQNGRVQGLKAGKATITAAVNTPDGLYTAAITVWVVKASPARIGQIQQMETP